MNFLLLEGRLVSKPDVRRLPDGRPCAEFSLACDRGYKNEQGQYPVDFIDCVAWDRRAEIVAEYGEKGRAMLVIGELQTRRYTSKKDGHQVKKLECKVDRMKFMSSAKGYGGGAPGASQAFADYPKDDSAEAAPGQGFGDYAILEEEDGGLPF